MDAKFCFQCLEKSATILPMIEKLTALLLLAAALAGCSTPVNSDGSKKEYSDMPWNTPQTWEGSVGIPGMSGYE